MKIVTWNVNSIRARLEGVVAWLQAAAPEVVLLQETKVEDFQFPYEALGDLGYDVAHYGQKTYNGVAILSRGRAGAEMRFESKGQAFHERLREGFLAIARAEPERCAVIDATGSPDEVAARVWAAVEHRHAAHG